MSTTSTVNFKNLVMMCKKDIVQIYKHAVESVLPDKLVKDAVYFDDSRLILRDPLATEFNRCTRSYDLTRKNLHVIGGGKGVSAMARGLAEIVEGRQLAHLFSHGCLSLPVGLRSKYEDDVRTKTLLNSIGVECLFGSENNLPDNGSVQASEKILKQIVAACEHDKLAKRQSLFIILISGGGSACLTSPKYIDLDKKLDLIKLLVQKGANIVELNKVRRFFSNIKGGRLAKHILRTNPDAEVLTLILSDVIGDPVEFIASGPTYLPSVAGQANLQERLMMDVLTKYNIVNCYNKNDAEGNDDGCTIKCDQQVLNMIIGSNKIAINSVMQQAKILGYHPTSLGNNLNGPTHAIVDTFLDYKDKEQIDCKSGKYLQVGGGEATVELHAGESWGEGGRAQESALDYIIKSLSQTNQTHDNQIEFFLFGSTDGQDGPTDVAACIASSTELLMGEHLSHQSICLKTFLEQAKRAKQTHDSCNFWKQHKPDWLIRTGLTETNVMDIYARTLLKIPELT